jgi:hypothetical protein
LRHAFLAVANSWSPSCTLPALYNKMMLKVHHEHRFSHLGSRLYTKVVHASRLWHRINLLWTFPRKKVGRGLHFVLSISLVLLNPSFTLSINVTISSRWKYGIPSPQFPDITNISAIYWLLYTILWNRTYTVPSINNLDKFCQSYSHLLPSVPSIDNYPKYAYQHKHVPTTWWVIDLCGGVKWQVSVLQRAFSRQSTFYIIFTTFMK